MDIGEAVSEGKGDRGEIMRYLLAFAYFFSEDFLPEYLCNDLSNNGPDDAALLVLASLQVRFGAEACVQDVGLGVEGG